MKDKTVFDYATILKALHQIAPRSHIAGGSVRDTILQKPIHDIDIFVSDEHVDAAAVCLRADHGYVKVGEWTQYESFSDPAMTRVAKFERADETIPICIIGLMSKYADASANMARFDFGVCMAAYYGGEKMIQTYEFELDVRNKTFTLCRADNAPQFAYSMSRFRKITANRYAGWKLAIPEMFQALAKEHAHRRDYYWDDNGGKFCRRDNILKPKERTDLRLA